jgi:hypothetical protein
MATLRGINIIVRIVPPEAGEARTGTGSGTNRVSTIREVKVRGDRKAREAPEDLKVPAVHQAVTNSRTDMAGIRTRGAAIKAERLSLATARRGALKRADRWETGVPENRPVRRDRPGFMVRAADRTVAGSTAAERTEAGRGERRAIPGTALGPGRTGVGRTAVFARADSEQMSPVSGESRALPEAEAVEVRAAEVRAAEVRAALRAADVTTSRARIANTGITLRVAHTDRIIVTGDEKPTSSANSRRNSTTSSRSIRGNRSDFRPRARR